MHIRISTFLLLLPFLLVAQSNYKKAYAVTKEGDTLHGFVHYREWYRNPDNIAFKQQPEDAAVHYLTPDNTFWFAVAGYESYASHTVSISMNELRFDRLQEQPDTATQTKTVFLKEIVKGDRLVLYSYKDAVKERYYIQDDRQATPRELIYRKTLKDMEEHTDAGFRQQLLRQATHFDALTSNLNLLIQNAAYSKDDLKKVVSRINSRNEPGFTQALDKKRSAVYFVMAGLSNSRISYTGESIITVDRVDGRGNNKYKPRTTTQELAPRFSAGLDYYLNPGIRRLAIRTEVAATSVNSTARSYYKYTMYNDDEVEYTYRLSAWTFSFSPQVLYHLYNTANLKWHASGGASFNYVHAGTNNLHRKEINQPRANEETTTDYIPLRKYALQPVVQSGIQLKQRVHVSLVWSPPVEYTNYAVGGTSIKSGLLAFSVGCAL